MAITMRATPLRSSARPPRRASAPVALVAGIAIFAVGAPGCQSEPAPAPRASVSAAVIASSPPSAAAASVVAPKPKRPSPRLEDCPKTNTVTFTNPELEAEVRRKVPRPTGPVTTADLGRVRTLNLSQLELEELDVCLFGRLTALKELFLGRGKITDLSPLAKATGLESLRASLNPIEDLTPLAGMTRMDRMDLAHTAVRDLTPLAGMTHLSELLLDDTPVSDVTPLAKLEKLTVLVLKNTQVKDVSALRGLRALKTLDLRGTAVEDATMLMRPGLRIDQY